MNRLTTILNLGNMSCLNLFILGLVSQRVLELVKFWGRSKT